MKRIGLMNDEQKLDYLFELFSSVYAIDLRCKEPGKKCFSDGKLLSPHVSDYGDDEVVEFHNEGNILFFKKMITGVDFGHRQATFVVDRGDLGKTEFSVTFLEEKWIDD